MCTRLLLGFNKIHFICSLPLTLHCLSLLFFYSLSRWNDKTKDQRKHRPSFQVCDESIFKYWPVSRLRLKWNTISLATLSKHTEDNWSKQNICHSLVNSTGVPVPVSDEIIVSPHSLTKVKSWTRNIYQLLLLLSTRYLGEATSSYFCCCFLSHPMRLIFHVSFAWPWFTIKSPSLSQVVNRCQDFFFSSLLAHLYFSCPFFRLQNNKKTHTNSSFLHLRRHLSQLRQYIGDWAMVMFNCVI